MKFRKKPIIVDAEQWLPGSKIQGVREIPVTAVFSVDGEWYYIEGEGVRPTSWLHTKENEAKPYAFWSVQIGEKRAISPNDDLYRRYAKRENWHNEARAYGLLETIEGRETVESGDWIITDADGFKGRCKPDTFEKMYEPA